MPSDSPGVKAVGYPPPPVQRPRGRVHGTLAGRISLVTTLVTLITAIIVGVVLISQVQDQAKAEARSSLSRATDTVTGAIERTGSLSKGRAQLAGLRAGGVDIERVLPGGRMPTLFTVADVNELAQAGTFSAERKTDRGQVFVEARRLTDGSVLILTQTDDVTAAASARGITTVAVALALGVVIAVFAGFILARRLARPLQVAAGAANQMAQGQRGIAITPEGPREVADVAEALNDLNEALAVSEARQREFLLSVSHELRTPLTSLNGYAEAISDGVVPADQLPATADIMVAEARRLDRLVADLLDLARMGAREVAIDAHDLDVAAELGDAAKVWHDLCQAEGVEFVAEIPSGPISARTDGVRLRQIIDNLMANALRMTPSGRGISLSGMVTEETITVVVNDGGPGLTAEDCQVAFEPAELYSRYQGVRKVGSGVGLALVGRLAHRLGGSAQAGASPSGGAAFTIHLARYLEKATAGDTGTRAL